MALTTACVSCPLLVNHAERVCLTKALRICVVCHEAVKNALNLSFGNLMSITDLMFRDWIFELLEFMLNFYF